MSSQNEPSNYTRIPAVLTEFQVATGICILYGIYPEPNTTAGTITIRDAAVIGGGSTPVHVAAIGLPQAGKTVFAEGHGRVATRILRPHKFYSH